MNALIDSYIYCLVARRVGMDLRIVFEESYKEKLIQVFSVLDNTTGKLHEPLKVDPREGANE